VFVNWQYIIHGTCSAIGSWQHIVRHLTTAVFVRGVAEQRDTDIFQLSIVDSQTESDLGRLLSWRTTAQCQVCWILMLCLSPYWLCYTGQELRQFLISYAADGGATRTFGVAGRIRVVLNDMEEFLTCAESNGRRENRQALAVRAPTSLTTLAIIHGVLRVSCWVSGPNEGA
jgi:hypothetical protein